MTKPLRRMYSLEITLDVDRWQDLLPLLRERIEHFEKLAEQGPLLETKVCSVMGGASMGGSVVVYVDPKMTPEAYAQALESLLSEKKP